MTDPMLRALPDDVADLLALERDAPVPAGVPERVLARVEATVAGPPAAAAPAPAVASAKPVVAAIAAALLGLGGAATYLVHRSAGEPAARPLPELAGPAVAPRARAVQWRSVAPERSALAEPAVASRSADRDTLAAERALLDRAQAAVLAGDGAAALAAVAQHTDRFRRGVLIEEREALRVQGLVVAGRAAEARERGARFLARYPRSIQRGAVRAALEALP